MPLQAQTRKRYRVITEESNKGRQLSGLFSIISNNLLLATEVLSADYKEKTVYELELLSQKAKILAKQLASNSSSLSDEELSEKISSLKTKMLTLVESLSEELGKLHIKKDPNQKTVEDIVLARRLLRESQRGLVTI